MNKKKRIDKSAVIKALLLTALVFLVLIFCLEDLDYLTQVVSLNYGLVSGVCFMFIFLYGFFSMVEYVAKTILMYDSKLVLKLKDIKKGYKAAGKRLDKQFESECKKLVLEYKIKNIKKELKKHD